MELEPYIKILSVPELRFPRLYSRILDRWIPIADSVWDLRELKEDCPELRSPGMIDMRSKCGIRPLSDEFPMELRKPDPPRRPDPDMKLESPEESMSRLNAEFCTEVEFRNWLVTAVPLKDLANA